MDKANPITYFAETDSRNKRVKFGIKAEDRLRHVYSIGKTGMGKSTMLENMAVQDIQNGEGMAFLDPHGKTADLLLDYIPEHRVRDVIYFAPFDTEYPISFNVMEDVGVDKRHLVLSGLMSAFEKFFGEESFSDRMQYILQNTILALLEYPGATMLGINKMLTDKAFRKKVVDNVTDTTVKTYWTKEFAAYTERFAAEATPAIQNKMGQFVSNPLIRNIIGQSESALDFRKIMDERKILIVNLSKGLMGESNANLVGSMLVTKMYLAAMSRADSSPEQLKNLPNFYLYVDEFQSFANKSFADILSEARKYKLSLNITHQYVEQMAEEVRAAVFGNVGTMISFRIGSYDAEILEKEFAPVFTAEDMVNLGFAQIYLKLMIDGVASQPFSATTLPPIAPPDKSFRKEVLDMSRRTYAKPKTEVEKGIEEWHRVSEASSGASETESRTTNHESRKEHRREKPRQDISRQDKFKQESRKEKDTTLADALKQAMQARSTNHEVRSTSNTEEKKENNTEQKISLKDLKKDDKNKSKQATEENKSALKDALRNVVRESSVDNTPKSSNSINEVPESVLRQVLSGR